MITKYISDKINVPVVEEPNDTRYHRFDDGSCECEVGEFLYALVRLVKPENVLETGIYFGIMSSYIALAIKENGFGRLDSIEWEKQHVNHALHNWSKVGVMDVIEYYNMSSLDFSTDKGYQLVVLDTEPQIRFTELERFWDNILPGGIVVIHDLSWDLGTGAPECWLNKHLLDKRIQSHELQVVNFKTPRGLTMFYKCNPGDEVARLLKG